MRQIVVQRAVLFVLGMALAQVGIADVCFHMNNFDTDGYRLFYLQLMEAPAPSGDASVIWPDILETRLANWVEGTESGPRYTVKPYELNGADGVAGEVFASLALVEYSRRRRDYR